MNNGTVRRGEGRHGCGATPILPGVTLVIAIRACATSLRSDSAQQHAGTLSTAETHGRPSLVLLLPLKSVNNYRYVNPPTHPLTTSAILCRPRMDPPTTPLSPRCFPPPPPVPEWERLHSFSHLTGVSQPPGRWGERDRDRMG